MMGCRNIRRTEDSKSMKKELTLRLVSKLCFQISLIVYGKVRCELNKVANMKVKKIKE